MKSFKASPRPPIFTLLFIVSAFSLWFFYTFTPKSHAAKGAHDANDLHTSPDTVLVTIGFVGDIMAHITQVKAQKIGDSTYDFNDNYFWVKPLFVPLDFMIGNLETVFGGSAIPYSTHPRFNTPDALAAALSNAGFNLLATANNHMNDQGVVGVKRTIEIIRQNGLKSTGSRMNETEPRYTLETIGGIKVAIAAFTYESGRARDEVLINGLKVNREDKSLVNSFTPFALQEAIDSLRVVTNAMQSDGSEIQIMILHWGDEFKTLPNAFQRVLADSLRKMGVDIIFGSHPHVIQPVVFERDSLQGNDFLVTYSCGNFISNHRFETKGNYYTEDGLFVIAEIEKVGQAKPRLKSVTLVPLWVNKYWKEGRNHFEVVPVDSVLSDSLKLKLFSKAQKLRMENSLKRTRNILHSMGNEDSTEARNKKKND